MNSALHRPVSRKFWVGLLLTVVGLLVLLVLYPVVEGVLGWYCSTECCIPWNEL